MSTASDDSDLHLLAAPYALDALEPADRIRFDEHLRECDSCRAEVAGLAETAALLAAGEAEAPRAWLRDSVLAAAAITPQLPPAPPATAGTATADDAPDAGSDPPEVEPAPGVVVPLPRRRVWSTRLLAAAAVVLAVTAGGLGWRSVSLSRDLQQQQALTGEMTTVLTSPDAATVSGAVAGGGDAAVVASASLDRAVVVTDGMAPAPTGHVYQLWLISPTGQATSAGLMAGDGSGQTARVLEGPIHGADAIGVTVEPAGGSTAPTTKPVVSISI